MRNPIRALWVTTGGALAVLGLSVSPVPAASAAARTAPKTTLGIWIHAEDSGKYSTVPGQHPDIANYYLAWGQAFPKKFIKAAEAHGATPFIEIEPWHAGPSWNETPSMASIGSNTSADCGPSGTSSCLPWLKAIGKDVASFGHPVIFTFAHEFNVSGQYPWAYNHVKAPVWIKAWDTVQADINNHGAGKHAWWMWAPNAYTGGSTKPFTPWWPGASHVNMVGVDGYPQSGQGWGLCDFQELFGQSFTEMESLTSLPVFISETDLAPLGTSQDCNGSSYQTIPSFIAALFKHGGNGILQWQDGSPSLTSKQWSELDAALSNHS